jgi:predicted P-loop ATPase
VKIARVDLARLERERDQLWAEARVRFERGEAWYLDEHQARAAAAEAEQRYQRDPWEEAVDLWLCGPNRAKFRSDGVSTRDVLTHALRVDAAKRTRADESRAGAVLRRLGWSPQQVRRGGGRVRVYLPDAARVVVTGAARVETPEGVGTTSSVVTTGGVGTGVVTTLRPRSTAGSSTPSLLSQPDLSLSLRNRGECRIWRPQGDLRALVVTL